MGTLEEVFDLAERITGAAELVENELQLESGLARIFENPSDESDESSMDSLNLAQKAELLKEIRDSSAVKKAMTAMKEAAHNSQKSMKKVTFADEKKAAKKATPMKKAPAMKKATPMKKAPAKKAAAKKATPMKKAPAAKKAMKKVVKK